jgi:hypothetical protein
MATQTNTRARVLTDAKPEANEGTLLVAFQEALKQQLDTGNAAATATFNTLLTGVPVIAFKVRHGSFAHGTIAALVKGMGLDKPAAKSAQTALSYAAACVNGNANATAIKGCLEARSADEARTMLAAVKDEKGESKLVSFSAVRSHFARVGGADEMAWVEAVLKRYAKVKPGTRAALVNGISKVNAELKAAAEAKIDKAA